MKNLGSRLEKIISYVNRCSIMADVGCDHGKVGTELLLRGVAGFCYFSDISEACLNKARAHALSKSVYSRCDFINCNGFVTYPTARKIDYAVVSGMGGIEISSIVLNRPKDIKISKFVLQPNNNVVYLRRTLVENGFKIEKDEVVQENNMFYNILLVSEGIDTLSNDELEFGRTNLIKLDPAFKKYLEFKLGKLLAILESVKGTDKEAEVVDLIERIKSIVKKGEIKRCNKK